MENVRKYEDTELVRTPERFRRIVANPAFNSGEIIGDYLFFAKRKKKVAVLAKPIYTG